MSKSVRSALRPLRGLSRRQRGALRPALRLLVINGRCCLFRRF